MYSSFQYFCFYTADQPVDQISRYTAWKVYHVTVRDSSHLYLNIASGFRVREKERERERERDGGWGGGVNVVGLWEGGLEIGV